MVDMPCAVISSTVYDLPDHRKAAQDACLRQDFFPKMMEFQAGRLGGRGLPSGLVRRAAFLV